LISFCSLVFLPLPNTSRKQSRNTKEQNEINHSKHH